MTSDNSILVLDAVFLSLATSTLKISVDLTLVPAIAIHAHPLLFAPFATEEKLR
jgi:hypothetical protein